MSVADPHSLAGADVPDPLVTRIREATALLEEVVRDRAMLMAAVEGDRIRLLQGRGAASRAPTPSTGAGCARRPSASSAARAPRRRRPGWRRVASASCAMSGCSLPRRTFAPQLPGGGTAERYVDQDEVQEPQHCYVCKQKYSTVHHFYDQLCPPCAEFNFASARELADLRGRVALLTGGRVKIGYQAGLKLLRAGARADRHHALSRATRPRATPREPDFAEWGDRLEIFGLDLRHTPSVEAFCRELLAHARRLDFIINNACQTVRRPPDFYAHMMEGETAALHAACPKHVRTLLGSYEGAARLRHAAARAGDRAAHGARARQPRSRGLTHAAELSQVPLLPDETAAQSAPLPRGPPRPGPAAGRPARSATPGGCCWPRCRRSSCSRCSWSTRSRRSSSTRGSSR